MAAVLALRTLGPSTSRLLKGDVAYAATVALLAVLSGVVLVVQSALLALLIGAVLLLLLVAASPVNLAVLTVPGVLLVVRLPGGALSATDAALLVAALASLPALGRLRRSAGLTRILTCFSVYVGTMTVVLAVNPSVRSALELLHRVVLVAGALAVGAWLAGEGRSRVALSLLMHAASAVAAVAVLEFVRGGFEPAYPLGFHKNYIGGLFVMLVLLLLLAPSATGLRVGRRFLLLAVLLAGAAACQSRGALAGGAAGLLIAALSVARRSGALRERRRAAAAVLLALLLGAAAAFLLNAQLAESGATDANNSLNARLPVEVYAQMLWREQPVTGNGIRYFADPAVQARSPLVQPPNNVINEALAEGGVVQALGLMAFLTTAIISLSRSHHPLVLAGLALVVMRFTHGMVDIYWTAGNSALPWLVVGMGLWLGDNSPGNQAQPRVKISRSARSRTVGHA